MLIFTEIELEIILIANFSILRAQSATETKILKVYLVVNMYKVVNALKFGLTWKNNSFYCFIKQVLLNWSLKNWLIILTAG